MHTHTHTHTHTHSERHTRTSLANLDPLEVEFGEVLRVVFTAATAEGACALLTSDHSIFRGVMRTYLGFHFFPGAEDTFVRSELEGNFNTTPSFNTWEVSSEVWRYTFTYEYVQRAKHVYTRSH